MRKPATFKLWRFRRPGKSPAIKTVLVRPGLSPVEFRLETGHTIRGRVVDQARLSRSRCLRQHRVRWRGEQILDWQTETDSEGRFDWDGAPEHQVLVSVGKTGYRNVYGVPIDPSTQEKVITLTPGGALRIKGTVVDAETGKPIPSFRIVPAVMGGSEIWLLDYATMFRNGRLPDCPLSGKHPASHPHRGEGLLTGGLTNLRAETPESTSITSDSSRALGSAVLSLGRIRQTAARSRGYPCHRPGCLHWKSGTARAASW